MSKWFIINIIIFCFAWSKIMLSYHGFHVILGGLALTFILYNWMRQAVFSSIRSPRVDRQRKIFLAKWSKRALPFHKWTGSLALLLGFFHLFSVLNKYGLQFERWKLISGLMTITALLLLVSAGWLRWYRTTVKRRYIHWTLGFIVIFLVIFHLLI